jgi:resorcinol 4-hydroxylase (FADH2)
MLADAYRIRAYPKKYEYIGNRRFVSKTIFRGKMSAIKRTAPSVDELVRRSSDMRRVVREAAEQTERARQVPPEIVSRMRDAGLFRIMQPAIYGGYEYGFEVLVRVVSEIGAGCGSAGWVFSLGIVHQWLLSTFPKQAQDEYFADPDALAFGSYAPTGKVSSADGGYRLSGRWAFTSGCDHASWLVLGAIVPDVSGGLSPSFFLLPKDDVHFDDNWFTVGLAGTGSKDTVVENAFVPAHRAVAISDLLKGATPGARAHKNPLYHQSLLSVLPFCLVAPLLGIAEGALADFVDMARTRNTRGAVMGGNNPISEFATIQARVAEATGSICAARSIIFESLDAASAAATAGTQADPKLRLSNRLKQSFSARLLAQAVNALFLATGGQGIFTAAPIQRAWRDIHAGSMHVSLAWDAVSTMYGQYALGLEPKGQY